MRRELLVKFALSSVQPGREDNSVQPRQHDEFAQVESHLSVCPSCNLRVKAYRQLYQNNQAVSAEFSSDDSPLLECIDESHPAMAINEPKPYSSFRRGVLVPVVLLLAVGLSTLVADHFTRPRYYGLASVRSDRYDQIILYRERSSLLQAIFLFRSGNYEKAIPAIEASIATRDGSNMRPYLRLMQGLAYLKLAESNTYGLFPRFDMNRVEAAIVTFQACIDEATSPEMAGVRASAYIYQAKAYLMSGNAGAAQQALREAAGVDDELAGQAKQLLNEVMKTNPESGRN